MAKAKIIWLRPSDYARKHGITPQAVTNRIARNALQKKKGAYGVTLVADKPVKKIV